MKYFIILSLVFSFELYAETYNSLINILLPKTFHSLEIGITKRSDVRKLIGKPDLIEERNDYYQKDGIKYPVEITFDKKDILEKIYYRFTGKEVAISYKDIAGLLEKSELKIKETKEKESYGRYLEVKIKKPFSGTLTFLNNSDKSIYSIILENNK